VEAGKELILSHKEFAETIVQRLQDKIKEYEKKLNEVKTESRKIVIKGKIMGLTEAIDEMNEFVRQLETWYE